MNEHGQFGTNDPKHANPTGRLCAGGASRRCGMTDGFRWKLVWLAAGAALAAGACSGKIGASGAGATGTGGSSAADTAGAGGPTGTAGLGVSGAGGTSTIPVPVCTDMTTAKPGRSPLRRL